MIAPITALRGPARLREMLKDLNKIIVAPVVYDGISARVALATGFDALHMVSSPSTIPAIISLAQPNHFPSNPNCKSHQLTTTTSDRRWHFNV
jgi:hypothetical protein